MWAILVAVIVPLIYWGYHHIIRELREIDPVLLNHQSSISETRKPSESAIYRSVDVPHGVSVTRGLNLSVGYKIRDGCLKDIWHLALRSAGKSHTTITLGKHRYTIGQVNTLLHQIKETLDNLGNIEAVALFGDLMESPELLLVVWTCFFITDIRLIYYNSKEDFQFQLEDEVNVLFTSERHVEDIPLSFKEIIGFNVKSPFTRSIDIDDVIESSFEFNYNPQIDFEHVNNQPYSFIRNRQLIRFYQLNFLSAVASKVMSIPSSLSWSTNDNLLISYTKNSCSVNNIIFETCCGLVSGLNKIDIINSREIPSMKSLAAHEPTIICIDSHILKQLCNTTRKSFMQSFILQRSEYFNSLGYFNRFGRIEKSLNLKVAYVAQLTPMLSSFISNFCKSVLGSRIIREIYTDFAIGPILKTNVYDYRVIRNKSLALSGVPANSVELKTINPKEGNSHGKLLIRGMSVGKSESLQTDEEHWVDTGLEGTFAKDGCFYTTF
ncbi:uncharacterized protein C5L36_0B03280 [Pichia kudriavzevii]|uniref:AMP-dependent synthetase/ligase domain-containing protein n=1 Tax=Pichia kudriavzevii TaxID=4909 RepID=A0A2U9R199_PICKU|nr:uncharacterized protein C5L36_0B03280 [Pichia kudriavzevii]AWU75077.1 hypothetical protein C5L36_0B03280 [Pichia kudriavzevii]